MKNNNLSYPVPDDPRSKIFCLAQLLENFPDAVFSIDSDNVITTWNNGAENLFGYPHGEVIGKNTDAIGLVSFTESEKLDMAKKLAESGCWTSEKECINKNGHTFPGSVTATVVKGSDERIHSIFFIIKDITRYRQLQAQLTKHNEVLEEKVNEKTAEAFKNERRFRALIENNNEIISVMDASFKFVYRSPSAARITDWSDEEIQSFSFVENLVHPDDREKVRQLLDKALHNPGVSVNVSYRVIGKHGKYILMEGLFINLLDDENIRGIVINLRDMTEQRQKEQQLEINRQHLVEREQQLALFIEHSPAAVAMFDASMRYLVVSRRWITDYKLGSRDIIGQSHYAVFPEITQEWKDIHQECLKGVSRKQEADLFTRADGSVTWLHWEIWPWYTATGAIGGIIIFTEDITDRKMAEQEILKSEEKYRALVESVSDGFIALDAGWNFSYINQVAEKMINQPLERLIGKNIWEAFPEVKDGPIAKAYHKAMQTQQSVYLDEFSVSSGRWLRISVYPSPSGLSVFFRDISEQRKAEIAAQQSEEIRKKIMASALDAIICADMNGEITLWNAQAARLFGWNDDEIMGKTLIDTIIPPQHRLRHAEGFKKYRETGEAHILNKLTEITAMDKNGKQFPIELFIVAVNLRDNQFFCAFIRDISERKAAEDKILKTNQQLIKAQKIAHVGIVEVDIKKRESLWSEESCRLYGLDPAQNIITVDDWLKMIHPDDRAEVRKMAERSFITNEEQLCQHRIVRTDGEIRHLITYGQMQYDNNNQPAYLLGVGHDITNITMLQQELREQQRQEQLKITAAAFEAQERERNALGAELHDNVNQILVGTKIVLSVLKNTPGQAGELATTAIANIQQAINENRKIAHELVAPDFEGKSLVKEITHLAENMLRPASISIQMDSSGLEENLLNDQQKLALYRVAQEQCTNIVKYSEAKLATFRLGMTGQMISMVISDNGKGMDTGKKTSGIGLKNIRSRVSILQGTVSINTAPGKGLTMEVCMPVVARR